MRTPKENKQILRDRTPKSTAGTIPKAVLKAAWLKTKEQSRTTARENDTDPRQQEPTDLAGSAAEQAAAKRSFQGVDAAGHGGRAERPGRVAGTAGSQAAHGFTDAGSLGYPSWWNTTLTPLDSWLDGSFAVVFFPWCDLRNSG